MTPSRRWSLVTTLLVSLSLLTDASPMEAAAPAGAADPAVPVSVAPVATAPGGLLAIRRVLARGNGANLMDLLSVAKGRIYSNLPKFASGAPALYVVAKDAHFKTKDGVVFGPWRWVTYTGTYTFQLKLHDVRRWVDNHFTP